MEYPHRNHGDAEHSFPLSDFKRFDIAFSVIPDDAQSEKVYLFTEKAGTREIHNQNSLNRAGEMDVSRFCDSCGDDPEFWVLVDGNGGR